MPAGDVEAHLRGHQDILEQYTQLCFDLMQSKTRSIAEISQMVKAWIIDHLVEHDLKIRPFAAEVPAPFLPARVALGALDAMARRALAENQGSPRGPGKTSTGRAACKGRLHVGAAHQMRTGVPPR